MTGITRGPLFQSPRHLKPQRSNVLTAASTTVQHNPRYLVRQSMYITNNNTNRMLLHCRVCGQQPGTNTTVCGWYVLCLNATSHRGLKWHLCSRFDCHRENRIIGLIRRINLVLCNSCSQKQSWSQT